MNPTINNSYENIKIQLYGEIVNHTLQMKGDMNTLPLEFERRTPLTLAIFYGFNQIAQELVNLGSSVTNIDEVDLFGDSPLAISALKGNTVATSILIKAGAKTQSNQPTNDVELYANEILPDEIYETKIETLQRNLNEDTEQKKLALFLELSDAIMENKPDKINTLLSKGVNINQKDDHGFTPLMMASMYKTQELLAHLLKVGASIDEQSSNEGASAMMLAIVKNKLPNVKFLIDAGANIDLKLNNPWKLKSYKFPKGANALAIAKSMKLLNIVKLLEDRMKTRKHKENGSNDEVNVVASTLIGLKEAGSSAFATSTDKQIEKRRRIG